MTMKMTISFTITIVVVVVVIVIVIDIVIVIVISIYYTNRSSFTYVGGMYVYGVTWILLRQDSDTNLSPKQWKEFMVGSSIHIVTLSCVFNNNSARNGPLLHIGRIIQKGRVFNPCHFPLIPLSFFLSY